jgi:tripartite-type tricarboxylate transporter receptor subunit TctC
MNVAQAQQTQYPNRAIRIIVPFPAGGTVDILPRIVGERLSKKWGQAVVIENKAGAGGNIGAQIAATSAPDGYTIFSSSPGPLAINQFIYKKLQYDPAAFVPISLLGVVPTVLLTRKDLPVANLQDVVALARKKDGVLTYASQGNGTTSHLAAIMFQSLTKTKLVHVPYAGTAPAMLALVSGQVDLLFDNASVSIGQYRGGRIKMLAVAAEKRLELAPEIPTFTEAGLRNFESRAFIAFVAPPGTDPAIAETVSAAVDEALKDPDVRKRFAEVSVIPQGGRPEQLSAFLKKEIARLRELIPANSVSVD